MLLVDPSLCSKHNASKIHLLEVGCIQQSSDLKFMEECGKVLENAASSGEQVAEAGHNVQQGAQQAAGFSRKQSLKRNTT